MAQTSKSFYATLPSNACLDFYPDNKQACYKIELPQTLYLAEGYEVALAEIQYPFSWKTFAQEDSYTILIQDATHSDPYSTSQQVFFPSSYYQSIGELTKTINQTLRAYFEIHNMDKTAIFKADPLTQKIRLEISNGIHIYLQEETCDVLGFEHDTWIEHSMFAPYQYNMSRGFHSLFVYCSLCEAQIVGNDYVPLLRSVAINGKRGDHVIKIYGEPHYVPVNSQQVTTVEINIKDDTNRPVPFLSGKVVCKLHFRQQDKE